MLSKLILIKLIFLSILFIVFKEPKDKIIEFLHSENYTYSSSKKDIPKFALDYLGKTETNKDQPHFFRNTNSLFEIGDSTELNKINVGDCFLLYSDGTPFHKYTRKLNFVLYNDSVCLMAYIASQGFNIIDFIKKQKDTIKHIRYNSSVFVNNVDSLKLAFSDEEKIPYDLLINK